MCTQDGQLHEHRPVVVQGYMGHAAGELEQLKATISLVQQTNPEFIEIPVQTADNIISAREILEEWDCDEVKIIAKIQVRHPLSWPSFFSFSLFVIGGACSSLSLSLSLSLGGGR